MQKLVSLLPAESDVGEIVQELELAGVDREHITVCEDEDNVRRALNCDPVCMVRRYGLGGMAIGVGIYLVYAVITGWCQCTLFGFEPTIGLAVFLGGLLAGAFVGSLLGLAYGFGAYEEVDYHLVEKVRLGQRLLVVDASRQQATAVQELLAQRQVPVL